jgi:mRNA-degrading endonuclease YafQ of YafQ-DinJ toxin-antitoxin module
MIVRYSPGLLSQLKKINVRIRKRFKERIVIFIKDPINPKLNNHLLRDEWEGYRSIKLTNDWRAIYEELKE